HVPSQNLGPWLSGPQRSVNERDGDMILKESLDLKKTTDKTLTSELRLGKLLGAPRPGLYELKISHNKGGASQNKANTLRVIVTDIQVIAKRTQDEHRELVDVWAIDSETLAPLQGARA